MCNFTYIECRSCTAEIPCRVYTGEFSYCETHLYAYPRSLDHIHKTLMVNKEDEHGTLDDWADKVHLRTQPKEDSYLFGHIGCYQPNPVLGKSRPLECAYHKPGGIKERWNRMKMKGKVGAEKLIKEREREREAGKKAEEEKLMEKKIKRQKAEDRDDDKGCCVVQ